MKRIDIIKTTTENIDNLLLKVSDQIALLDGALAQLEDYDLPGEFEIKTIATKMRRMLKAYEVEIYREFANFLQNKIAELRENE